ncbi:ABC transporter permease [Methylocella sp.]|uniref:ABC transporter permease n=1 Tax=Methylocella sp. TaxID=1978226 RepID=UPI0035AD8CF3
MRLAEPFENALRYQELIRAVVRRELAVRFRGSILGWLWAIFGPLIMLSAYTVVFSSAVGVPNSAKNLGVGGYALSIFAGLIVFNLFSEIAYRSPAMLHEQASLIKKSIFPSETLAWTAVIRGSVYALISLAVLLVFKLAATWSLPATTLLIPLVAAPFFLLLLGLAWFLMALGSFTRDVAHLMISIVPVFMFATPIFYSIQDVPPHLRLYVHLNPIGNYVELTRDLLIAGRIPDAALYLGTVAASLFMFYFGYRFFTQYKAVFVDVI